MMFQKVNIESINHFYYFLAFLDLNAYLGGSLHALQLHMRLPTSPFTMHIIGIVGILNTYEYTDRYSICMYV